MNILALDLGTKCGWTLLSAPNNHMIAGTWDLTPGRHESRSMRFIHFRRFLHQIKEAAPVDLVVYEEVRRHLGTDAAHAYGGFLAVLQMWCDENDIPYSGIPVQQIKKKASGKGNCGKEVMLEKAKEQWPDFEGDDNEADARFLSLCAVDLV